jgi:hypothetical protein
MRHTLFFVLVLGLLGACGGSAETTEAAQTSTGGEVVEPMLPLEAYLSPSYDYVSVDLDQIRRHPFGGEMLEEALSSLERSGEPRDAEVADAVRRTSRVLALGSLEDAAMSTAAAWIFARGDFAGFQPETPAAGRVSKLGDHTLVVSETRQAFGTTGDPGERLDAAVVARVNIGDAMRASLEGVPARATVQTAERLRVRIELGGTISIRANIEHRDDATAQRSLDELSGILARFKPMLLLAPKPLRRIAGNLVLGREGNAVVARLDLTEQDIRDLGELAVSMGLEALLDAGEREIREP